MENHNKEGGGNTPQKLPWEEIAQRYNREYCRFKNKEDTALDRYYYRDDKWD